MEYKTCGEKTQIHNISLYNTDCMNLLRETPDNYYDLAICDPPYGIGRLTTGGMPKKHGFKKWERKKWDNNIPNKEYFDELKRVSKNQIIWGGNYYVKEINENSMGWIFWFKGVGMTWSDGELAYSSFNKALRVFSKNRGEQNPIHPTQKPIALYKWLLKNYAKEGDKILDTHCGSGSIAIATHYMGYSLTACELDKEYFDSAVERITNQTRQETLL